MSAHNGVKCAFLITKTIKMNFKLAVTPIALTDKISNFVKTLLSPKGEYLTTFDPDTDNDFIVPPIQQGINDLKNNNFNF